MWYLNREPQRAAGHFRAAWTLRPDNVATAPNLGNSLHRSGEPAAVVLREATRLGPTFAVAHRNLGNALREAGDLDGAVRSCREAVRLAPEHPVARYNLGIVLARQKDPDGAIGDMTSLVDWGPASDRRFSSQPPDGRAPGVGGVAPVFEQLRPPAVQFRRVATQAAGLAEQAVWHVGRVLDDRRDRRLRPRRVAVPADRTMATVRNGVWAGPVAPRWSRPDHLVVVRLRTPTLAESGSSRCGPTRAGGTEGHPGHIHDRRGAHRTDPAAIQRTPPP